MVIKWRNLKISSLLGTAQNINIYRYLYLQYIIYYNIISISRYMTVLISYTIFMTMIRVVLELSNRRLSTAPRKTGVDGGWSRTRVSK